MDPVTQGVLGAIVTQTRSKPAQLAKAACLGALAAMAPDLDILSRSACDPVLAIEFHRHFTHSLLFIPIGALICALVLHPLLGRRWDLPFRTTLLWCGLGYATHALLDGCTTYGTQLLWPFSDQRFAWDIVSVVDPLFTAPLLVMVWLTIKKQTRRYAVAGLGWVALYLSVGALQHERALALGLALAESRGHQALRLEVKPSFANLIVWKVIYETDDSFYVDAVKPGLFESESWEGDSIKKLNIDSQLPWLDRESQQARDIERFTWFSAGYVALDPKDPHRIVDIRYSMLPQSIAPLWGIKLSPDADPQQHAEYYTLREKAGESLQKILGMMF